MERSHSMPPIGPSGVVAVCNDFYSEKVKNEIRLEQARPIDLPVPDDDTWDEPPVRHGGGGRTVGCTGKGRGVASSAAASGGCFVTPPSRRSAEAVGHSYGVGREGHGRGVQSQGVMPTESTSNGAQTHGPQPKVPPDDLQRALERELVDHLREQNSKLLAELEQVRQSMPASVPSTTTSSWTKVS